MAPPLTHGRPRHELIAAEKSRRLGDFTVMNLVLITQPIITLVASSGKRDPVWHLYFRLSVCPVFSERELAFTIAICYQPSVRFSKLSFSFASTIIKYYGYFLRQKFSPKNLVSNNISLMAIFAGYHPQRGR